MELESLVVPAASAAEEAGKLLIDLPRLWESANVTERRKLLLTMLDAVYFEAKQVKSIVAIKPKPPFRPVFQVAASKAGSEIRIINEPYKGSPVFLVETGESRTRPETRADWFIHLRVAAAGNPVPQLSGHDSPRLNTWNLQDTCNQFVAIPTKGTTKTNSKQKHRIDCNAGRLLGIDTKI